MEIVGTFFLCARWALQAFKAEVVFERRPLQLRSMILRAGEGIYFWCSIPQLIS